VDGLYEFTKRSFQDHFAAFLNHALLPLREYACHFYPCRSRHLPRVIPTKATYPNLHVTFNKVNLATSTSFDLLPVLESLLSKGKKFQDLRECKLWEASVSLNVPPDGKHEFWSRKVLRREDGKYENGIPINITAFGSSEIDARENAMLRLSAFLDDCRKQIQYSSRSRLPDSEQRQSQFKDDPVLQIARELLRTYSSVKSRISDNEEPNRGWTEISQTLERYLEDLDLRPLIKYYLVCNVLSYHLYPFLLLCVLTLIKASVRLHQKRPKDAIGYLISLETQTVRPRFDDLVRRRLQEANALKATD
jgi:hypothetical protein